MLNHKSQMTQRQFPSLGAPCDIWEVLGRDEELQKIRMKNQEEESYLKQKQKHDLLTYHKNKKNNTDDYHIALHELPIAKLHCTVKVIVLCASCLVQNFFFFF